jgi:hypothetical protein
MKHLFFLQNHSLRRTSCGEQQRRRVVWVDPGPAAEEGFAASSRLVICLHGAGLSHILRPAPAPSEAVKISSCRCRMTIARCRQPSPASSHPYATRSITLATATFSSVAVVRQPHFLPSLQHYDFPLVSSFVLCWGFSNPGI